MPMGDDGGDGGDGDGDSNGDVVVSTAAVSAVAAAVGVGVGTSDGDGVWVGAVMTGPEGVYGGSKPLHARQRPETNKRPTRQINEINKKPDEHKG